jgi:hypothetical protein
MISRTAWRLDVLPSSLCGGMLPAQLHPIAMLPVAFIVLLTSEE